MGALKAGPSVLVVEDDRGVARMLRFSLRDAGYDVQAVETGGAALEALRQRDTDAVVLDLGLPDQRSGEVLEHLRRLDKERAPSRPVWIVVTAQDPADVAKNYGPLGDRFLSKPFNPWRLVEMLKGLLAEQAPGPNDR